MRAETKTLSGALIALAALAGPASAQTSLPRPDPPFTGTIERTLEGSRSDSPPPLRPPAGAPNVVVVLIDDAGFGNPATFGAGPSRRRLSTTSRHGACATTASTSLRCAPRRALRCSRAATTTASASA